MSISRVTVKCFEIPTETPERDGTLLWQETKLVTVEIKENDLTGLGYTYADVATAHFIQEHAVPLLLGKLPEDNLLLAAEIKKKCRNLGNAGIASMALSAVDIALWDLKAKKFDVSIQKLIGSRRYEVPFYGSGLFINNSKASLEHQITQFKNSGIKIFKMKIGETPSEDLKRLSLVQEIIGEEAEIYVDANGRYSSKEALILAQELAQRGVTWFEEPITSDDMLGMKFLRDRFPSNLSYVAGEYCNQISDFLNLLQNGLVDIIQVDATRSEGISGALAASQLAKAFNIPVSTHCAPLLHGNIGVCLENLMISELFYDHKRIEDELFISEGEFINGRFIPMLSQKGFGWSLDAKAKRYLSYEHAA